MDSVIQPLNNPGQVNTAGYSDFSVLPGLNQIVMICTSTHFKTRGVSLQRESDILVSNANAQCMESDQNNRFLNDFKYLGRLLLEGNSGQYFVDSLIALVMEYIGRKIILEGSMSQWSESCQFLIFYLLYFELSGEKKTSIEIAGVR